MRILILGGYGVFGGRLAELLSDIAEIELIICGRDFSRAEAFCARYRGQAQVRPLALDRADIVAGLRAQRPKLVVDASGPFQDYGTDRYRLLTARDQFWRLLQLPRQSALQRLASSWRRSGAFGGGSTSDIVDHALLLTKIYLVALAKVELAIQRA